jgi:glycosyltransferase involved in cell wall biosynthesis
MEQFDLIWVHHLMTANVFERWAWPKTVMDIDDVPSTYLETVWRNADRWIDRLRARFRIHGAVKRERLLSERFPVLSVCSETDRMHLRVTGPIHVIPNGFEAPEAEPVWQPTEPPRIGFVGIFDYLPNAEGVRWFAEKCWPEIKRAIPNAQLRLIGRNSEGPLKPAGPDIHGLGYIEDSESEISTWSLMIVPIHFGAGTRVKIAEGLSRKVPIVATSVGAHGYAIKNGVELLIADSATDFAVACLRVLQDPMSAAEMANRGWCRFREEWSWDVIRPRIWATAEDCLRLSRANSSRLGAIKGSLETRAG